jgi:uncharacterized repeat protein (TIGR03806 family)
MAGLVLLGCGDGRDAAPYDLDFEIPRTEAFPARLSAYGLFQEPLAALEPTDGTVLYELAAELYTDQAGKQRLLRVPAGTRVQVDGDRLRFPEGTVLVKTFHYDEDARDPASGRRILETRLLVKRDDQWNAATYLWNDAQSDATLLLDGTTLDVAWTDRDGEAQAIAYGVPHEGECVTCHQADGEVMPIGPTLANLNRTVVRDETAIGQLDHLTALGILDTVPPDVPVLADWTDPDVPVVDRTRSYVHGNCAHCHRPGGWEDATARDLDFRATTPLDQTGLLRKAEQLPRLLADGEMPWLGVTLPDAAGIRLLEQFAAETPSTGR